MKDVLTVRLKGGFLDAGVVTVPADSKWIFIELAKPGVDLTTLEKKIPFMRLAAWPSDDAPVGRPPNFTGPMVCYRLLRMNPKTRKAEFEYDPKHSDDIVVEFDLEHPED